MPLAELPKNFRMYNTAPANGDRRRFLLSAAVSIVMLAGLGGNWLFGQWPWPENGPWGEKPVKFDEEGNPLVQYASLTPIDTDLLIPMREKPTPNSHRIDHLPPTDHIAVIEVYGSEYVSADDRGRFYTRNVFGVAIRYGRWFEVHHNGKKGYVSGNFITLLHKTQAVPDEET